MRYPLIGGYTKTRSLIGSPESVLNLFTEKNPPDAPFPVTHYLTPGLTQLADGSDFAVRCTYTASDGVLWVVIGNTVYWASSDFTLTSVGTIGAYSLTPVVMSDNRLVIVLVNGTSTGWWIDMTTKVMSVITDPAFYGANQVGFLDTFFIFDRPNSNQWYISPPEWDGIIAFDPLDIVAMSGGANSIAGLAINNRQIWLFGTSNYTEIWYNVGTPDFTFGRVPGVAVQHGCAATYSIAQWDLMIFWLGLDEAGVQQIYQSSNYAAKIISPPWISAAMAAYAGASAAIGYCYQLNGHVFYVLNYPAADRTWVYDVSEGEWHVWGWTGDDGELHRHRSNCQAYAYGRNIVGDWENGKLYALSADVANDAGRRIRRERVFARIVAEGDRIAVRSVQLDMDVGQMPGLLTSDPPEVSMAISFNKGASYGNPVTQSVGATGEYDTNVQFNQCGYGRDPVVKVFWDFDGPTALNGGWLDAIKAAT